jgi:hypothetical protein
MMDLLSNPSYLEEEGILNLAQASIRGIVGISGVYNIVRMANAPIYGSLVVSNVEFYSFILMLIFFDR